MHSMRTVLFLPILCLGLTAVAQNPAQFLLARAAETARATRTLTADIVLTRQSGSAPALRTSGSIRLMKPNYALVQLTGDDPPRTLASDGHDLFTVPDAGTYTRVSMDRRGDLINLPWWSLPARFFFMQSINPFGSSPDAHAKVTRLPDETLDGQGFNVLSVAGSDPMAYNARFYIAANGTVQRSVVDFGDPKSGGTSFRCELSNLRLDAPLTAASFRFTPPSRAKLKEGTLADTMLALGDPAPEFTLQTPEGNRETLLSERKGAKATLINFWYLKCPPCLIEFPDFEKLYQQFHSQGFNIVAIDKADAAKEVSAYARRKGVTFPILLGGENTAKSVFAQYRTAGIFPGTYLLDGDGRIVYRAAGGDPKGLREALARLGLQ